MPVPLEEVLTCEATDEMGSYDPTLSAFTPTKFLGSPNSSVCATGFDQLAFIEGSSSELFNEFNTSVRRLVVLAAHCLLILLIRRLPLWLHPLLACCLA